MDPGQYPGYARGSGPAPAYVSAPAMCHVYAPPQGVPVFYPHHHMGSTYYNYTQHQAVQGHSTYTPALQSGVAQYSGFTRAPILPGFHYMRSPPSLGLPPPFYKSEYTQPPTSSLPVPGHIHQPVAVTTSFSGNMHQPLTDVTTSYSGNIQTASYSVNMPTTSHSYEGAPLYCSSNRSRSPSPTPQRWRFIPPRLQALAQHYNVQESVPYSSTLPPPYPAESPVNTLTSTSSASTVSTAISVTSSSESQVMITGSASVRSVDSTVTSTSTISQSHDSFECFMKSTNPSGNFNRQDLVNFYVQKHAKTETIENPQQINDSDTQKHSKTKTTWSFAENIKKATVSIVDKENDDCESEMLNEDEMGCFSINTKQEINGGFVSKLELGTNEEFTGKSLAGISGGFVSKSGLGTDEEFTSRSQTETNGGFTRMESSFVPSVEVNALNNNLDDLEHGQYDLSDCESVIEEHEFMSFNGYSEGRENVDHEDNTCGDRVNEIGDTNTKDKGNELKNEFTDFANYSETVLISDDNEQFIHSNGAIDGDFIDEMVTGYVEDDDKCIKKRLDEMKSEPSDDLASVASVIVKQAIAKGICKFYESLVTTELPSTEDNQDGEKTVHRAEKENLKHQECVTSGENLYSWDDPCNGVENEKGVVIDLHGDEECVRYEPEVKEMVITPRDESTDDFEKFFFKQTASKHGITIESPEKKDSKRTRTESPVFRSGKDSYEMTAQPTKRMGILNPSGFHSGKEKFFNYSFSGESARSSREGSLSDAMDAFKTKALMRGIHIKDASDSMTDSDLEVDAMVTVRQNGSRQGSVDGEQNRFVSTPEPGSIGANLESPDFTPSRRTRYLSGGLRHDAPEFNPDSFSSSVNASFDGSDAGNMGDTSMRHNAPVFKPSSLQASAAVFEPNRSAANPNVLESSSIQETILNHSVDVQVKPEMFSVSVGTETMLDGGDVSMVDDKVQVSVNNQSTMTEDVTNKIEISTVNQASNTDNLSTKFEVDLKNQATMTDNLSTKFEVDLKNQATMTDNLSTKFEVDLKNQSTITDNLSTKFEVTMENQCIMADGLLSNYGVETEKKDKELERTKEQVKQLQIELMRYKVQEFNEKVNTMKVTMATETNNDSRKPSHKSSYNVTVLEEAAVKVKMVAKMIVSSIQSGACITDLPDLLLMFSNLTVTPDDLLPNDNEVCEKKSDPVVGEQSDSLVNEVVSATSPQSKEKLAKGMLDLEDSSDDEDYFECELVGPQNDTNVGPQNNTDVGPQNNTNVGPQNLINIVPQNQTEGKSATENKKGETEEVESKEDNEQKSELAIETEELERDEMNRSSEMLSACFEFADSTESDRVIQGKQVSIDEDSVATTAISSTTHENKDATLETNEDSVVTEDEDVSRGLSRTEDIDVTVFDPDVENVIEADEWSSKSEVKPKDRGNVELGAGDGNDTRRTRYGLDIEASGDKVRELMDAEYSKEFYSTGWSTGDGGGQPNEDVDIVGKTVSSECEANDENMNNNAGRVDSQKFSMWTDAESNHSTGHLHKRIVEPLDGDVDLAGGDHMDTAEVIPENTSKLGNVQHELPGHNIGGDKIPKLPPGLETSEMAKHMDTEEVYMSPVKKPSSMVDSQLGNTPASQSADGASMVPFSTVPDPNMLGIDSTTTPVMLNNMNPVLYQAVLCQLIQAYPDLACNQEMLTKVAIQQTCLLQTYMANQAGSTNTTTTSPYCLQGSQAVQNGGVPTQTGGMGENLNNTQQLPLPTTSNLGAVGSGASVSTPSASSTNSIQPESLSTSSQNVEESRLPASISSGVTSSEVTVPAGRPPGFHVENNLAGGDSLKNDKTKSAIPTKTENDQSSLKLSTPVEDMSGLKQFLEMKSKSASECGLKFGNFSPCDKLVNTVLVDELGAGDLCPMRLPHNVSKDGRKSGGVTSSSQHTVESDTCWSDQLEFGSASSYLSNTKSAESSTFKSKTFSGDTPTGSSSMHSLDEFSALDNTPTCSKTNKVENTAKSSEISLDSYMPDQKSDKFSVSTPYDEVWDVEDDVSCRKNVPTCPPADIKSSFGSRYSKHGHEDSNKGVNSRQRRSSSPSPTFRTSSSDSQTSYHRDIPPRFRKQRSHEDVKPRPSNFGYNGTKSTSPNFGTQSTIPSLLAVSTTPSLKTQSAIPSLLSGIKTQSSTEECWDAEVNDFAETFTIPGDAHLQPVFVKPEKLKNYGAKHTKPFTTASKPSVRENLPSSMSGLDDITVPKPKPSKPVTDETSGDTSEEWCQVQTRRRRHSSTSSKDPQKDVRKVPTPRKVTTPSINPSPVDTGNKNVKRSNFERLVGRIMLEYPYAERDAAINAIGKIRESRGSLSGLSMEVIIEQAGLYIKKPNSSISSKNEKTKDIPGLSYEKPKQQTLNFAYEKPKEPPMGSGYEKMKRQTLNLPKYMPPTIATSYNDEDICVICHDPLTCDPVKELDCRHMFHTECISQWVQQERTCPTCRTHALFPEDFPRLGK